jgi:predicted nucleic acid-binding protein
MLELLIDAGPLVALFHRQDRAHPDCLKRFQLILSSQSHLITSFPVLCEVHKLIQQYSNKTIAQQALSTLQDTLEILPLQEADIESAIALTTTTDAWLGTLQDATIIVLARQMNLPVWTLDYRDFSRFSDILLWN